MKIDAHLRRAFARATGIGFVVSSAFAVPATVRLFRGALAPTESSLGEAIASAFGGVTLPIVGAAVAASAFGEGSNVRARADRLVAAGREPREVVVRPLAATLLASVVGAALAAGLTVLLLRLALRMRAIDVLLLDVGGTAWGASLGAATWTAFASIFVVRSARPARAYAVVAVDLVLRLLPGAAAWVAPSAHVSNVLGAPPPRGLLHVPVLPQLASVGVLIVLALLLALLAARRYDGPFAR